MEDREDVWRQRVDALWERLDAFDDEAFLAEMGVLADERPPDDAEAPFERASAFDSTGHSDRAVPLYRTALAAGLEDPHRRRAIIQLASSLRNLGDVDESVALLEAERTRRSDELDDAVSAFLALALCDAGREREGAAIVLAALAPHLPRYQRSLAAYARELGGGSRLRERPDVDL